MKSQRLQRLLKGEKKPIEAISPDGTWEAYAARENSIVLRQRGVGYWGTYRGHQDGIYHRTHATIGEITWESDTIVRSTSSTGSIHRWSVPQCVHVETIRPAPMGRSA